jgi:energy-coupling factor transporter ATP-binding protein EcfA2
MVIRPLAKTRADQRQFVDRTHETRSIMRAVGASQNVLLLGEAGSGRTSLLNHVAWLLTRQEQPRDSLLVSGESTANAAQLLGVLVARVQRLVEDARTRGRWLEDLRALSMPDGPFGEVARPAIVMELVDLLGEALASVPRAVCLMVDGISPAVAHGVFGTLRNELWALQGASWVVAGDSAAGPLYREPPADAFFELTVELESLPAGDARRLLRFHAPELGEAEIEQALVVARGNPRRLLRAATEIQAGATPTDSVPRELAEKAEAIAGPLAKRLIEHLAEHGSASASDATMLRQIGASRQRASQLMHQLESAGLLQTIELHEPGRRGRPARRFALKAQV